MTAQPATNTDTHTKDTRLQALMTWLTPRAPEYGLVLETIRPASADASFRRYFRLDCQGGAHASLIAMDAPPPQEATGPFVTITQLFLDAGLNTPRVLAHDAAQGFVLLTDLGQTTYLHALLDTQTRNDTTRAHALMIDAIDALVRWQAASRPGVLPPYDAALLNKELALFPDWYINRHLGLTLNTRQRDTLDRVFGHIVTANLAQGLVYVHRDYMPRNLMCTTPNPGILDFQDAVFGPISYDIASLMRDAFISWNEDQVLDWTIRYWERARAASLPIPSDFGHFWRDVEWMGLQRHLKVLGIFARIQYRDGKPQYLADSPRFVRYVRDVAQRYDTLAPLAHLLDDLEGMPKTVATTF